MFFPHNFVSESIYFLLNSDPKLWKQKWKPGEEKTFVFLPPFIMGEAVIVLKLVLPQSPGLLQFCGQSRSGWPVNPAGIPV